MSNLATVPAAERPHAGPKTGELEQALLGLQGIFWALKMLSNQQAADQVDHDDAVTNGIANLIAAGECLAAGVTRRF